MGPKVKKRRLKKEVKIEEWKSPRKKPNVDPHVWGDEESEEIAKYIDFHGRHEHCITPRKQLPSELHIPEGMVLDELTTDKYFHEVKGLTRPLPHPKEFKPVMFGADCDVCSVSVASHQKHIDGQRMLNTLDEDDWCMKSVKDISAATHTGVGDVVDPAIRQAKLDKEAKRLMKIHDERVALENAAKVEALEKLYIGGRWGMLPKTKMNPWMADYKFTQYCRDGKLLDEFNRNQLDEDIDTALKLYHEDVDKKHHHHHHHHHKKNALSIDTSAFSPDKISMKVGKLFNAISSWKSPNKVSTDFPAVNPENEPFSPSATSTVEDTVDGPGNENLVTAFEDVEGDDMVPPLTRDSPSRPMRPASVHFNLPDSDRHSSPLLKASPTSVPNTAEKESCSLDLVNTPVSTPKKRKPDLCSPSSTTSNGSMGFFSLFASPVKPNTEMDPPPPLPDIPMDPLPLTEAVDGGAASLAIDTASPEKSPEKKVKTIYADKYEEMRAKLGGNDVLEKQALQWIALAEGTRKRADKGKKGVLNPTEVTLDLLDNCEAGNAGRVAVILNMPEEIAGVQGPNMLINEEPLFITMFNKAIVWDANYGWLTNKEVETSERKRLQKVLDVLVKYGADINSLGGHDGMAPIHQACITGNCKMVSWLIGLKAQMDLPTPRNELTGLMIAAKFGHIELMGALMRHPESLQFLQCTDCKGMTALHIAANFGQTRSAMFLLRVGANKVVKDNQGRHPGALAIHMSHLACSQMILGFNPPPKSQTAIMNYLEKKMEPEDEGVLSLLQEAGVMVSAMAERVGDLVTGAMGSLQKMFSTKGKTNELTTRVH